MKNISRNLSYFGLIFIFISLSLQLPPNMPTLHAQTISKLFGENSYLVSVDSIYINELAVRGLTARFPYPIMARISIIDTTFKHVSGLSNSVQWVGPNDIAENGRRVSDIWTPILEYHRDNPAYPAVPDLYQQTPTPLFTEIRNDTLLPLSTMLVMDASWSMYENGEINNAITAAHLFVNLSQSSDRMGIIAFDDKIFVNDKITDNKDDLNASIDKIRNDTSPGKTALFDALMVALDSVIQEDSNRRRNIIVYADGEDNASDTLRNNLQTVIARAKQHHIQVHTIALGDVLDVENMQLIAFETGGYFFKVKTGQEMISIYEQLVTLLHSYYLMAFTSPDPIFNNTWREVAVTVNSGVDSGADKGTYFVPGQPDFSLDLTSITRRAAVDGNEITRFVLPGDSFHYKITVKNIGPGESNAVVLVHHLPDSVAVLDASITPQLLDSDSLLWQLDGLQPDEERLVTVRVKLAGQMPQTTDRLISTAYLTDALARRYDAADTVAVKFSDPSEICDVAVRLTASTDSISIVGDDTLRYVKHGESYSYKITVANESKAAAKAVTIVDRLPSFVSYLNATPAPAAMTNDSVIWTIGKLASLSSTDIILNVRASNDLPNTPILIINTAQVSASNDDLTLLEDNIASDTVRNVITTTQFSDVAVQLNALTDSIAIVGGDTLRYINNGENYTYQITITNKSAVAAIGVSVVDRLPDVVHYLNANPTPAAITGDSLTWNIGNLAPLASTKIVLNVRAANELPNTPILIVNTAEVFASNDNLALLANNVASDTVHNVIAPTLLSDVAVQLTAETDSVAIVGGKARHYVHQDESYSYKITVTNKSTVPAEGISVVDRLPDLISYLNANPTPTSVTTDSLTWTIGNLAPLVSTEIILNVRASNALPNMPIFIINDAQVSASNDDLAMLEDNIASDTVHNVIAPTLLSDVAVRLTASTDSIAFVGGDTLRYVNNGESYSYKIAVTNESAVTAIAVSVVDRLPNIVSFLNANPTPAAISTDSLVWNIGNLAPLSSTEIILNVRAANELPDTPILIVNTAQVSAVNDDLTLLDNNFASNTVHNIIAPSLLSDVAVRLTATTDSVAIVGGETQHYIKQGESYSYKIIVTNESDVTAEGVIVVDKLPSFIEYENSHPGAFSVTADSLIWQIGNLAPRSSAEIMIYVHTANELPDELRMIINTARVTAENEDTALLANNVASVTLYNATIYCADDPSIVQVIPSIVDIGSRLTIRIKVFAPIQSWDLWLYFANGQIDSTFADDQIAMTSLLENEFIELQWELSNTHAYIENEDEELIFEVRTLDICGNFRTTRATITTQNTNDFILVQNVYLPHKEEFFPIQFKLSSNRMARLDLYDIAGTHITILTDAHYPAGWNTLMWNGLTESGLRVGSGVYIVTIRSGELNSWKKMIIVL